MEKIIKYLESVVHSADKELEKFQQDIVKKGYGHALEWSGSTFSAAARKQVAQQHLDSIKAASRVDFSVTEETYLKNTGDKIIQDAQFGIYGTGVTNNLYKGELRIAEAQIHQHLTRGF